MEFLSIFSQFSEWAAGGFAVVVAGVLVTIARKKGINLKKILGRASIITQEIGEAFLSTSNALKKANGAIKDNGKLIENSVDDVIRAGKQAILEWEDVVMIIKPKKKLNP